MSENLIENQALLSLRIVSMDYYVTKPVQELDVTYSKFRSSAVKRVPVIRVFGSTLAGQKACLHLHGIFPYIFIPVPAQAAEGFVYRLAASIDKALNIGMTVGENSENLPPMNESKEKSKQHVFKITEVSGKPFYGYHPREHLFYKVYFYNPWMLKRAADMLQSGAILGQIFQPHYSHVPFILQFMMDYNLQGMNPIHLKYAKFRTSSSSSDENENLSVFSEERLRSLHYRERVFEIDKIPSHLLVSKRVSKVSSCQIEIDAKAPDILNSNLSLLSHSRVGSQLSETSRTSLMNPGLEAVCQEEIERRERLQLNISITPPSSPPRGKKSEVPTSSQEFWAEKFHSALSHLLPLAKESPEPGKSNPDPDSTNLFDPQNILNSVYPAETPDGVDFPDATFVEDHIGSMSLSISNPKDGGNSPTRALSRMSYVSSLDENPNKEQYFNDTHVDLNILNMTLSNPSEHARTSSQGKEDDELLDVLLSLELNRGNLLDIPVCNTSLEQEQEEQDKLDTLEMTQVCWDVDPHLNSPTDQVLQTVHEEGAKQDLEESKTQSSEDLNLTSLIENDSDDFLEKSCSSSSSETWKDTTFWSNIDIESLDKSLQPSD